VFALKILVAIAATSLLSMPAAVPGGLRPETLRAFERYVRLTEARMQQETTGASPLLWLDRQPAGDRAANVARLDRGEVISTRLETRDGGARINADGGLIHHWVGTVFLPGAKLDRVKGIVQNYARYPEWFSPLVRRATVTSRTGDHFRVAMRTEMRKVLTVTVDADYLIDYRPVGTHGLHVRSLATALHLVDSPGTADERRTPADQTFGFLWRLNTYCTFSEIPRGTYEQCESLSLTRDIPFGLGPVVRPLVSGIPRETLEFTLGQVRKQLAPRN
jgi:hypothetical protein